MGELVVKRVVSFLAAVVPGLFCLPMFLFGSWLLGLWITIQVRRCVYLEYPYLAIGIAFVALGIVALLCVLYGTRRRGYWGVLLLVPVIMGLWAMIVIPNILPSDGEALGHLSHAASALDFFSNLHTRYPADDNDLKEAFTSLPKERSLYRENGRELPFRIVLVANATGPFLGSAGNDPGVMFYAVSSDRQEAWLTATELGYPVGNHVRFASSLSLDGDSRVFHRRVSLPQPR